MENKVRRAVDRFFYAMFLPQNKRALLTIYIMVWTKLINKRIIIESCYPFLKISDSQLGEYVDDKNEEFMDLFAGQIIEELFNSKEIMEEKLKEHFKYFMFVQSKGLLEYMAQFWMLFDLIYAQRGTYNERFWSYLVNLELI